VTNLNDAPTISLSTNRVTTTAGVLTGSVTATVADIDSNVDSLTLSASSSDTNVVADVNVFFSGTGATRTFTIAPKGAATGTATLTIRVSDGSLTGSATIDVTVNTVRYAVVANAAPIVIDDNSTSPYPSSLAVANVNGLIGKVTVVLADVSHPRPDDLAVLLVGPGNQKVILMRQAGDANAVSHARITFDDAAADIPSTGPISTATYHPADYGTGNVPGGAPVGPYATSLSAFNSTSPIGTWSLYAIDTVTGQVGRINGGWLLNIFPAPTIS